MSPSPAYRIYQPPSNMLHIFPITARYEATGYTAYGLPHLHWRPFLSLHNLVSMGLDGFQIRYSDFSYVPTRWQLDVEESLPLRQPINILARPGVIFLQEVVDLTDAGELVVYGWNLSQVHTVTTHTGGFMVAIDFVIPYRSVQRTTFLRLIRYLPKPLAQFLLHLRYR